jgi:hypothetical protein
MRPRQARAVPPRAALSSNYLFLKINFFSNRHLTGFLRTKRGIGLIGSIFDSSQAPRISISANLITFRDVL